MRLEDVLRNVQTNHANLAHGRSPCLVESQLPVWHTDAVGGRPHNHCEESVSFEAIQSGTFLVTLDCFAEPSYRAAHRADPLGRSNDEAGARSISPWTSDLSGWEKWAFPWLAG